MPFQFEKTHIEGVILVKPRTFKDDRGWFFETYKASEFAENGINVNFLQDNHSFSTKNVIRGIHFQKSPKAQGKLVRCVRGTIFDVAVDLRPDSPTFKKWVGYHLSEENKHMLWIPEGLGHGFSALTDQVEITYKCTDEYDPKLDGGIRYDDPELGIQWDIENPNVSDKDKVLPYLKDIQF